MSLFSKIFSLFRKDKTDYSTRRKVKTPVVLQMEAVECGAASLGMIFEYYGVYVPLERLRVECGVSRDGTKASNMVKAARRFGFEASGYKLELESLKDIDLPVIIFWDFNHFVVLEGIRGNKVYINDPAVGRRQVTLEDFDESFTGVTLTFKPGPEFKKIGKKPNMLGSIKSRMEGTQKDILFMILAGLLMIVPGLVAPIFGRVFIDSILVHRMTGLLKPLLIAMIVTSLITNGLGFLQGQYMIRFEERLSASSYSKFLMKIFRLPAVFFTQRMPGEICQRIETNDAFATFFSKKFASLVLSLFSGTFYLILMFSYDWILSIVVIISNLVNFFALKIYGEKIQTGTFKNLIESGKLSGVTMNGFQLIESIKANGNENGFFQTWSGQQAKVLNNTQKLTMLSNKMSIVPSIVTSLVDLLILFLGVLRIIDGHLTIGMLMAFRTIEDGFSGPINEFLGLNTELQQCKAALKRLDDVVDYPAEERYADSEEDYLGLQVFKPVEKLSGKISVKNVNFGYSILEPPLIQDLNIEFKPGMRIALVGGSGSGKSTIAKLISSLYKPWSGEILFDGKMAKEIDKADFINSISIVDQDIFLFEGTVKDNITMWNDTIPESDYIQAAKDACIHDMIASRDGGYLGKVEEYGSNFSGGQRQRLEIARALASNPSILIMDEATSALDPITELEVDKNIRRRGCTCVIVAHRLSTIRDADKILVLDHGKVVQSGTHEELIKVKGLYQELIKTM